MKLAPDIHGDFGVPWIYINHRKTGQRFHLQHQNSAQN